MTQSYLFEFTADVAIEFMNSLVFDRKIKGRTFNNYLMDYRTFFNALVKNRYITANPFHSIAKMREDDTDKRHFTDAEAQRYFKYVKEHDWNFYLISLYCYYLALRPAEICRLKFTDFNLNHGVAIVSAANAKTHTKRIIPIAGQIGPVAKRTKSEISRTLLYMQQKTSAWYRSRLSNAHCRAISRNCQPARNTHRSAILCAKRPCS